MRSVGSSRADSPPYLNQLTHILAIDKNGDAMTLAFPAFHNELLTQSYWNAGDDLGRIKIIISEGLPRESAGTFERIKNVVAFSFQHAPLGLSTLVDI